MGKIIKFNNDKKGGNSMCISIDYIENKASEILKKCDINSIPIDPILVANKLEIKVYEAGFKDCNVSGLITKEGDEVEIFVEEDHHPNRQRFTIAHEIGHFNLHIDAQNSNVKEFISYQRNNHYDSQESEANRFAAALLMPRDILQKEYKKDYELDDDILITILARKFAVSELVMKLRLSNLGLIGYGW